MIALFVGKRKMDNTGYARRIVHVVKNIMLACAIGLVLVMLVFAVTWSVKELFAGGDVYYKIAGRISIFVGVVIVPMLSCIFVDGQEPETKPAGILGVFLNYIFTPALLVYTLILYVYTIRILIRWELPQGGVAYMVLAYMGFAMICYLLGYHTEKHPFKCFYRWLPLISVPFIILLWTGVLRRIADYGFTTGRVYLLAASTLVTIFDVLMFFERTRDFRKMTIALGVVAFVLNIPGISAINIGERSQLHRLESVLPIVTQRDGDFKEPDYDAMALDPELEKAWRKAASAYGYLQGQLGQGEFHECYNIKVYGRLEFNEELLSQAKAKVAVME